MNPAPPHKKKNNILYLHGIATFLPGIWSLLCGNPSSQCSTSVFCSYIHETLWGWLRDGVDPELSLSRWEGNMHRVFFPKARPSFRRNFFMGLLPMLLHSLLYSALFARRLVTACIPPDRRTRPAPIPPMIPYHPLWAAHDSIPFRPVQNGPGEKKRENLVEA